MKKSLISLVVPCYNEAEAIGAFLAATKAVVQALPYDYEWVFVDDGSTDDTFAHLIAARETEKTNDKSENAPSPIRIIRLSRNFGKEAALTCGILHAKGDAIIPMDADLQDPPELIPTLCERWQQGFDVVVAKRTDRSSDGVLKRASAALFYALIDYITEMRIPNNVGDYRLITRRVQQALAALPESERFMKGLFAWVGFKTAEVPYTRAKRTAGKSKFAGWRLWNFALDGITSFSTVPLKFFLYGGVLTATLAMLYAAYIVGKTVLFGSDLPGYPSLFVAITLLSGLNMIGIGILGEYIGRIYMESKRRPVYIIDTIYE